MEKDVDLLVSERQFVKIIDGEEIDINANDLTPGDIFSLYSDKDKTTKCYWDKITVFKCEGEVYTNIDNVEFIPCSLVK